MWLVGGGGRKCTRWLTTRCLPLWDEAKECYGGALQSLVGSASRQRPALLPNPAASALSDTAVTLGA
jgi:hypothetical protein